MFPRTLEALNTQDDKMWMFIRVLEIHLPFNICLGITLLVLLVRTLLKGPVKAAAVTLLSIMWILERSASIQFELDRVLILVLWIVALLIIGVGRVCQGRAGVGAESCGRYPVHEIEMRALEVK
jgi:hypothetical protein